MIPEINYIRPRNLSEALEVYGQDPAGSRLIAGGTDILPGFQIGSRRFRDVKTLIDIHSLPELSRIRETDEGFSIGGAVTFTQIMRDGTVRQHFPLLVQAASTLGSVQIRNRASLTGNFVNNAPCADSVPPLLVYDARLRILSADEKREISLADFLLGPYRTQLRPGEIVSEILLPKPPEGYHGKFYKLGRRRGVAISRITLAVLIRTAFGKIDDIRIASGAVTPIGKRFPKLEALARGKPADPDFLKELAARLGEQIIEVTGLRWSSAYKLPVVQQMFYQLLREINIR